MKADYGFFFKSKSKADTDQDPYTMFADSWETAALPRCRHVLEHTEAIVLVEINEPPFPDLLTCRIHNARGRVFVFTPGGPQAC